MPLSTGLIGGELCAGSLPAAWTFGGPVVAVWGFVIVAACSFLVALSLAELASCYPLAGGPYFW